MHTAARIDRILPTIARKRARCVLRHDGSNNDGDMSIYCGHRPAVSSPNELRHSMRGSSSGVKTFNNREHCPYVVTISALQLIT